MAWRAFILDWDPDTAVCSTLKWTLTTERVKKKNNEEVYSNIAQVIYMTFETRRSQSTETQLQYLIETNLFKDMRFQCIH
jgi:hypothetical protein